MAILKFKLTDVKNLAIYTCIQSKFFEMLNESPGLEAGIIHDIHSTCIYIHINTTDYAYRSIQVLINRKVFVPV